MWRGLTTHRVSLLVPQHSTGGNSTDAGPIGPDAEYYTHTHTRTYGANVSGRRTGVHWPVRYAARCRPFRVDSFLFFRGAACRNDYALVGFPITLSLSAAVAVCSAAAALADDELYRRNQPDSSAHSSSGEMVVLLDDYAFAVSLSVALLLPHNGRWSGG